MQLKKTPKRWTCWESGSELSYLNAMSFMAVSMGHFFTLASTAGYHANACPLEAYFWLEASLLQSGSTAPSYR